MYQSGVLLANASTDQDLLEPVMIPNCLTILMATNKVWCLYGRAHDCDTWDDIISAARRRSNIGISSACDTSEQAKQADTPLAASTAQNRPMHRIAAYSSFLYDLSVLTGKFICTTRTQTTSGLHLLLTSSWIGIRVKLSAVRNFRVFLVESLLVVWQTTPLDALPEIRYASLSI